jgi:hypothetical protein
MRERGKKGREYYTVDEFPKWSAYNIIAKIG